MKTKKELPAPLHDECNHTKPMHTPMPWRLETNCGIADILEGDKLVAGGVEINRAARIVRAVNAHEEMLEALQALGTYPGGYCFCLEGRDAGEVNAFGNAHTGECEDARKAIAKAEGK